MYVTLASDLCSYPTNGLVAQLHQTIMHGFLQLHLTSSHVFIMRILSACMSVTVSSYQHPCMLHLHPTISHVCNNCTQPLPMCLTVANQQSYHSVNLCLQACMADILAPDQQTYLLKQYPTICVQQTRKVVMVVTIALGKQACTNQQSRWSRTTAACRYLTQGLYICADTLHSISFFL